MSASLAYWRVKQSRAERRSMRHTSESDASEFSTTRASVPQGAPFVIVNGEVAVDCKRVTACWQARPSSTERLTVRHTVIPRSLTQPSSQRPMPAHWKASHS